MTLPFPVTFAHRVRQLPLGVLLVASLAGCPYIGGQTHKDNVAEDIVDADNDGVAAQDDCDDNDATAFPGNTELCDGVDNNCDNLIDEDFVDLYLDNDEDGFGDVATDRCNVTDTTSEIGGDCDDGEAARYPGNPEVCDALDNDCNTLVHDALPQLYVDRDRDGFGNTPIDDCTVAIPSSTQDGDCDDNNSNRFPGNLEICDEIDNDCNANTGNAGLATLVPQNGNPPRNLDTMSTAVNIIAGRTDRAEVRFCSGTFEMTFQFQNNTQPLLMSGLGRVELKPVSTSERVVYVEDSVLELNNLTVVDGNRTDGGGGLFCLDSTVTLNAVGFRNNTAPYGAALLADNCGLDGDQVTFDGNSSSAPGGVIAQVSLGSTVDWSSTLWTNNTAQRSFTISDSVVTLDNPTFEDDTPVAIYLTGNSTVTISSGNFSRHDGTDLQLADGPDLSISGETISCSTPSNTCIAR